MFVIFIIFFLGCYFAIVEGLSRLPESRKLKDIRNSRKRITEKLVKRALDEMNDIWKLRSKAFNVLWGTYTNVRVFIYATVKFKKNVAYIKFYIGASKTEKAKWAPEYVYELSIQDAEFWSNSEKDLLVAEMKLEYSKLLRRYL